MARHNDLGAAGEALAAAHLQAAGLRILERGWRCALGQIDLIAKDGDAFVFVEVKARSGGAYGSPEEGLSRGQRKRIIRAALAYLKRLGGHHAARFDVVSVELDRVEHHRDAFSAEGTTY